MNQAEKCAALSELHQAEEAWLIPNPWDGGSAKDLEKLGYKALATSSAACAYTLGKKDSEITLEEKLNHCRIMAAAVSVPISVDFEDGFDDDPALVAANILKLAGTGVAGCSIEDFSRVKQQILDFDGALAKVNAAVEALASLDMPFQLVARADGLIRRAGDLDDIIKRLQAFADAGAHMVYAPGLASLEQIEQVAGAVSKPINVLSPLLPGKTVKELGDAGATRISLGNGLLEKTRGLMIASMKDMQASDLAF